MDDQHRSHATGYLTLDESARRAMRRIVESIATQIGEEVEHADTVEDLEAAIERAKMRLRLMRGADTGTISLQDAAAVLDKVRDWRRDVLIDLAHDRAGREQMLAGDRGWAFFPDAPIEDNLDEYRRLLDRHLDELHGCDSFLRQMGVS